MAPIIAYRRFATFFLGAHFGKDTSIAVWPFGSRNHKEKFSKDRFFGLLSGRSLKLSLRQWNVWKCGFQNIFPKIFFRFLRRFFKISKTHFFSARHFWTSQTSFSFGLRREKVNLKSHWAHFPLFKWVTKANFEQIPTLREKLVLDGDLSKKGE